ncbi:hypothetical protein AAMO2058_000598700 [Amorphochlora amoebiformis]
MLRSRAAAFGPQFVQGRFARFSTQPDRKELGLLVWGKGKNGQLGFGDTKTQFLPSVLDFDFGEPIRTVRCGGNSSAVITESGKLFTWGSGAYHVLGHGDQKDQLTPKAVEFFMDKPVKDVEISSQTTFVITEEGTVYSWGWGGRFTAGCLAQGDWKARSMPTEVMFFTDLGKTVDKISIGTAHAFALVEGKVYAWGRGDYGRLGIGRSVDLHTPESIEYFEDYDSASDISAGKEFASCVSPKGEVLSWGANDALQLGIGPSLTLDVQSMEADPRSVRGLDADATPFKLACGPKHATMITTDGRVYEWGQNRSPTARQVTLLNDTYGVSKEKEKLDDHKIIQVASGKTFSIALSDLGYIFIWGGKTSCLGIGESSWEKEPIMFANRDEFAFPKVVQVACGEDHVVAAYEIE